MKFHHIFCAVVLALSFGVAQAAPSNTHFLAARHAERGVACEACHGTKSPAAGAAVETAKCYSCHQALDAVA